MKPTVLCVNRDALIELGLPKENTYGLYNIQPNQISNDEFAFINRKIVDSNTNDSYIDIGQRLPQILGYVVVINEKDEILTYSRGKGAEVRLKKRSIGIGGHCDIEDVLNQKEVNYLEVLKTSINRELKEEIDLDNIDNLVSLGLISDSTEEVGLVHVGCAYLIKVNSDMIKVNEDELSNPQWFSLETLRENKEDYENWSKILIDCLKN